MKKGISGKIADPADTGRKLNVRKTFSGGKCIFCDKGSKYNRK